MVRTILGFPLVAYPEEHMYAEAVAGLLRDARVHHTVAGNLEKLWHYHHQRDVRSAADSASLTVPDGSGMVLAHNLVYRDRVPKIDLPAVALECAQRAGSSVFLFGSREEPNARAARRLTELYPGLVVAGRLNGYDRDWDRAIECIRQSGAQLILVGLGSPRQEQFVVHAGKRLGTGLLVCCGGAIDVIAGDVQRAPQMIQNWHLEWLFRLVRQPKRAARQIVLPWVAARVLGEAIRQRVSRRVNSGSFT